MARSLGGISFPKNARWTNQDSFHGVAQSVQPTLGGTIIVYANQAFGRPIEITIGEYSHADGIYRNEILELLRQPGATYSFVWDTYSSTVVFSHQDIPAEFVPLVPTLDHDDITQVFQVVIRLTEI